MTNTNNVTPFGKKVDLEKLASGGHLTEDGEWYEHNLEELAPHTKNRIEGDFGAGVRFCFDVKYSRQPSTVNEGGFHPVQVVEGVAGFLPTTFDIGASLKTCEENVRKANEVLGLTSEDVAQIIDSSMNATE